MTTRADAPKPWEFGPIRPLAGQRILDFTAFQQGPAGTTLLADLGAEVIKVEPPNGELGRKLRAMPDGFSPFFEANNRGKRSLAIDLKHPEGLLIIRRLLPSCAAVAHNFRPGVMESLELGYEDVREIVPDIVYVAASGYGSAGPLSRDPAFDVTAQALSGVLSAQTLQGDDVPRPMLYGIADSLGGLMLAQAVMVGLFHRLARGEGLRLEVSILGSLAYVQSVEIVESLRTGHSKSMRFRLTPTFGPYRCSDGSWLALGVVDPAGWPRLAHALEREDLKSHPEFSRARWRQEQPDQVESVLEAEFQKHQREHWLTVLAANDLPCAPVLAYGEMAQHPQILETSVVAGVTHPTFGELRVVGSPISTNGLAHSPGTSPALGADTRAILKELGLQDGELAALEAARVVAAADG